MKANDFIKEYGLGEAVELVNSVKFVVKIKDIVCDPCFFTEDCTLSYKELKHLVDSHDIVNRYESDYGESAQWFFVADYCKKHQLSPFIHSNYNEAVLVYNKFVEDVRSCQ